DVEPAGARLLLQQDVVEEAGLLPEQGVRAAHVPPELLPRGVGHRELVHAIDGRHGKPPWVGAGAGGARAGAGYGTAADAGTSTSVRVKPGVRGPAPGNNR